MTAISNAKRNLFWVQSTSLLEQKEIVCSQWDPPVGEDVRKYYISFSLFFLCAPGLGGCSCSGSLRIMPATILRPLNQRASCQRRGESKTHSCSPAPASLGWLAGQNNCVSLPQLRISMAKSHLLLCCPDLWIPHPPTKGFCAKTLLCIHMKHTRFLSPFFLKCPELSPCAM